MIVLLLCGLHTPSNVATPAITKIRFFGLSILNVTIIHISFEEAWYVYCIV